MTITFRVPGCPVPQPRQRIGKGFDGRPKAYLPSGHPVNAFKATVRLLAAQAYQGEPLEGPLALQVVFVLPRPKAKRWARRAMPRLWHVSKPDLSNMVKAVEDCLTGQLWRDDAQVCWCSVQKLVAAGDEQPGCEVRVVRLVEGCEAGGGG